VRVTRDENPRHAVAGPANEPAGERLQDLPPALQVILNRSSTAPKGLVDPGPTQAELEALVAAALTAPDHEGLRPFRFIHVKGRGREKLADTFVAIKRGHDPQTSQDELERTWKKTMRAPCLLAVVVRLTPDNAKVPTEEQYMSAGAAIYAVLLACQSLGYGAIMLSGSRSRHDRLRALLGIAPHERIVGFISIGTPAKPMRPKGRPDPRTVLETWDGSG
jgi:nitroreductase